MTTETITGLSQADFWNMPRVKEQQDIQKNNLFGSEEHCAAFHKIKQLMRIHKGEEFAQENMGNYED